MTRGFEFWFDLSCPYAYLAWTQLKILEARTGARPHLQPFLLGGVFRTLGVEDDGFRSMGQAKLRHRTLDLERHARMFEVPMVMPEGHPFRTVDALRCLLAVQQNQTSLVDAFFRAYWVDGRDLGDRDVLSQVLSAEGFDARAVLEQAASARFRDELRAETQRALNRGVFGAPTFFVEDRLFFGMDRMDEVERAIGGRPQSAFPDVTPTALRPVDLWFDYTSPFAYVGTLRGLTVFESAARLRPMFLGGLFKSVGQVSVPMLSFSDAKRRWMMADLERQAEDAGIPFRFPSRFPINSVLPLRLTLAVGGQDRAPLVERLFRAYWSENRDISDEGVLAELVTSLGHHTGELLEKARSPEQKAALFASNEAAVASGVFGAPTYVVHAEVGRESLYWGADRLHLAAQASAGHTAVY